MLGLKACATMPGSLSLCALMFGLHVCLGEGVGSFETGATEFYELSVGSSPGGNTHRQMPGPLPGLLEATCSYHVFLSPSHNLLSLCLFYFLCIDVRTAYLSVCRC